jgi:hypothetical protein
MDAIPTSPRGALARLAAEPAYLLPRTARLPRGLRLGEVVSGDLIAVNGRWTVIRGCTSVNGWVTLDLGPVPGLTAHETADVHSARREASRVLAARR